MKDQTIVVVGGALAGPTAAARAREYSENARILLIERNTRISYATCGLSSALSGEAVSVEALNQQPESFFLRHYNIEVRLNTEVIDWNLSEKQLRLRSGGTEEVLSYSTLIYALGCSSSLPPQAPPHLKNLVAFRTLDDLATIRSCLEKGKKRVAVLGAGPMGVEAADALLRAGANVQLIESGPQILSQFSPYVAALASECLTQRLQLLTNTRVERLVSNSDTVEALSLTSGKEIPVDLVISAIGVKPRTELFQKAGGRIAADGSIEIDDHCRTSIPGVYACGTCVSVPQANNSKLLWSPQGALADKTAQVAGANAAGGSAKLTPALDSLLLRAGDITVGRTGLSYHRALETCGAQRLGTTLVQAPSTESYCKGSTPLLVILLWQRDTGAVLGVEIAGKSGVDKRVDAAAGSLLSACTLEQLAGADFGYLPSVSPLRDPLNVAATLAHFEYRGLGRAIVPDQLSEAAKSAVLLDLGSESGAADESIPGARRVDLSHLRSASLGLDQNKPIIVVSEQGRLSWLGSRILTQQGYHSVRYLSGGTSLWRRFARE